MFNVDRVKVATFGLVLVSLLTLGYAEVMVWNDTIEMFSSAIMEANGSDFLADR